jgi:CheY-like chemotaxis protein
MHVIIFDDLPESIRKIQMDFHCFDVSKYLKQDPIGQLKEISEKDFYPNEICKGIDEINQGIQSVTIVLNENLNWLKAVRLSCHLRFHNYRNQSGDFPIIITFDVQPDLLKDSNTKGVGDIQNFQYENGFFFKRFDELFEETEDEAGDRKLNFEIFYNEELFGKSFSNRKLEIIQINPKDHGDRHSIANQWGAIKLTLNAGYLKEDIRYDWPPTLYFKYLLKKHKSQILTKEERLAIIDKNLDELESIVSAESLLQDGKLKFSNHPYLGNKKVLLIDDNADKGWATILNSLFSGNIESREFKNVILDSKNKLSINLNPYSLVFLDLYLPDFPNQKTKISNGFLILKKIKEKYPHVPIIVFTASNKSWTLYEVLEKGADGMYVKESPEYAGNEKYSKENFESFVKTVIKCLDAYHILRPYWEKIVEIKENFLPEINDNELDKKFKSRIEERLEMFYGLLKRGMGQRKYDQERFYFSDYELAFMTLWSTLNEISEAYFDKQKKAFPVFDIDNGTKHDFHINRSGNVSVLDHFITWTFKRTGSKYIDFFVKRDGQGKIEEKKGFMKFYPCSNFEIVTDKDRNQIHPFFKLASMSIIEKPIFYTDKISMQTAFIVEVMNPINKIEFFRKIIELNRKRNSLYLTHGSDISSGFFSQKEKDKRNKTDYQINPRVDIKDLFELVAFLLTGKEMELKFE